MPSDIFDSPDSSYELITTTKGPSGKLPLTDDLLRHAPSGDLFGWSQNVGMGWNPTLLGGKEFTILSTHGGLRAEDGTPIALGFHSGHWEVGLLVKAAAEEFARLRLHSVCRGCNRPLRWSNPGHGRHVRQFALSQRFLPGDAAIDAEPSDSQRRDGYRHMRQGTAGNDDGSCLPARPPNHTRSGRCDAGWRSGYGGHGKGPDYWSTVRPRRDYAGRGCGSRVPCLCQSGRRLSVPWHRGNFPGDW